MSQRQKVPIEPLSLQTAANGELEKQFRKMVEDATRIVDQHRDGDAFETRKDHLVFEMTAKVTLSIDPMESTAWVDAQATQKMPKRKARRQVARVVERQIMIDVEPLPNERIIPFEDEADIPDVKPSAPKKPKGAKGPAVNLVDEVEPAAQGA